MSVIDTTIRVAPQFGTAGLFTKAYSAVVAWNDARKTRVALSKLTTRELDDIGLIPGDIDRISRQ